MNYLALFKIQHSYRAKRLIARIALAERIGSRNLFSDKSWIAHTKRQGIVYRGAIPN